MHHTTTLILLLAISAQTVWGQISFPSYEEAANHFANLPLVESPVEPFEQGVLVTLEKRPEGWMAVQQSLDGEQQISDLFWSTTEGFLHFTRPGRIHDVDRFLQNWAAWRYDLYPYYGHPSWELDVIKLLAPQPDRTSNESYLLARAYASYANNLLSNNSGTSDPAKRFDLPSGPNSLSSDQLKFYREYMHQALKIYDELVASDPTFNTIVGTVETKTATEYMTAFLAILMYQNEEEAMKEIAGARFPVYDLTTYRNILLNCKPDALLFTYGDTDTFTTLYLQAAEGLRRDVLVINTSMLRDPRYVAMLRRGVMGAKPLPISLTEAEIADPRREVISIRGNYQDATEISVAEALDWVRDEQNVEHHNGRDLFVMRAYNYHVETAAGKLKWAFPQNYFLMDGLIMMDLLNETKLERPIYFTSRAFSHYGFDKHVKAAGIAAELTANYSPEAGNFGWVDSEEQYELLMNAYNYDGYTASLAGTSTEAVGSHYIYAFSNLARQLIDESNINRAGMAFERVAEIFPNEVLPFGTAHLELAETHLRYGDQSGGIAICEQIYANVQKGLWPDAKDYIIQQLKEKAEYWGYPEIYPGED